MSKTVLGRGLNHLLGGTKHSSGHGTLPSQNGHAAVGRGFGTLLSAGEVGTNANPARTACREAPRFARGLPAAYLFTLDVLCLLLAWVLVCFGQMPSVAKWSMAGLAVSLGCGCGIAGAVARRSRPSAGTLSAPGDWILLRHEEADQERAWIIRTAEPNFAGEVRRSANGRVVVTPVAAEGIPELPALRAQELARAAAEAYEKISRERAQRLRAALV